MALEGMRAVQGLNTKYLNENMQRQSETLLALPEKTMPASKIVQLQIITILNELKSSIQFLWVI